MSNVQELYFRGTAGREKTILTKNPLLYLKPHVSLVNASLVEFTGFTFLGDSQLGGSVSIDNGENITFSDCRFSGSSAFLGGALRLTNTVNFFATNCIFENNIARRHDKRLQDLLLENKKSFFDITDSWFADMTPYFNTDGAQPDYSGCGGSIYLKNVTAL